LEENPLKNVNKVKKTVFHSFYFILCELVFGIVFTILLVYYGPFVNVRDSVVSTIMGTSSNHYLATMFLSNDKINNILKKTSPVFKDAKQNLNSITVANKGDKGIQIINIKEPHFNGKLILIKDPKRVEVGLTPYLGHKGATLKEIIKNSNAVGGINAGGFVDDNLMGTGGKPIGIIINNNKVLYTQQGLKSFNIIGFNKNDILVISNSMTLNEIKKSDLRCAASFGPVLVVEGKPMVDYGGKTLQPRSAIGQKKDGTVMLLAIDGRQLNSKGANYMELQNILLKYGAYNAANLDGGSSTTLIYNDQTINSPADIIGERSIPSAFLIMP
jgi:exopolysaccharide biosynthesis protein